jgi:predicted dehydrogenase
MIKVGFIGVGGMGMGQAHAMAKSRRFRVVAGADQSPRSCAAFNADFPRAAVYRDHRELLKDTNVDAVVVAVTPVAQRGIAIDAMKSGRDVLCEKPMARTVADCRRMIDAQEKTGRVLMVAHCRRFDTVWGAFAKLYRDGDLGRQVIWRHCVADGGPPQRWFWDQKTSGGPVMIAAIHDIDFAVSMFGDPTHVQASSVKLGKTSVIDTVTAVVHHADSSKLMFSWGWGSPTMPKLLDILGPKASLAIDRTAHRLTDRETGRSRKITFRKTDMYITQAKHFADCIEHNAKCISPATEAIKAVAVAQAILKAAPSGRTCSVQW